MVYLTSSWAQAHDRKRRTINPVEGRHAWFDGAAPLSGEMVG
jgi:hypothetical protein